MKLSEWHQLLKQSERRQFAVIAVKSEDLQALVDQVTLLQLEVGKLSAKQKRQRDGAGAAKKVKARQARTEKT